MPTIMTQTDPASAADAVFVLAAFELKQATEHLQKSQSVLNYAEAKVHQALLEKSKALSTFQKKRKEFNIAERDYVYYSQQQSTWLVAPTQEEEEIVVPATPVTPSSCPSPKTPLAAHGSITANVPSPTHRHFRSTRNRTPTPPPPQNDNAAYSSKRLRWGGQ